MIEVICNDRLGKKVRVKANEDDTIGDLKKLIAAQVGTRPEKIRIQKWYTVFKDHITLEDYEIHDGMGLDRLSLRFDAEGTLAQVNPVCIGLDQMGAPAHGLGFHKIHQIRAQDSIGKTRKILNVGGGHQLATWNASSLEPGD